MSEKFVLFLGGGTMSGMFGMGVLRAFQQANIYKQIEAVYGVSAGALNGAYFLAGQSDLGATVYYDDLVSGFIRPAKIPLLVLHSLACALSAGGRPAKGMDIVEIDYLFQVLERDKLLDINALRRREIRLNAKLIDLKTGRLVYADVLASERPMQTLKAAVSVVPYYSVCARHSEEALADGAVLEPLGVNLILAKYPHHRVVAILNTRPRRGAAHYLKAVAEGVVSSTIYRGLKLAQFLKRERDYNCEMKMLLGDSRVTVIAPGLPRQVRPSLTNRLKLLAVYNAGIEAGNNFVRSIRV